MLKTTLLKRRASGAIRLIFREFCEIARRFPQAFPPPSRKNAPARPDRRRPASLW
jgi:hypothetical protein